MAKTKKAALNKKETMKETVVDKENTSPNKVSEVATKSKKTTSEKSNASESFDNDPIEVSSKIAEEDDESGESMGESADESVEQQVEKAPKEKPPGIVEFRSRALARGPAKKPRSMSKKANLAMPVLAFWKRLKKGHYASKIQKGAAVYLAGVLEYLTAEVIEVSGEAAKSKKKKRISPRHITIGVRSDQELGELVKDVTISQGGVIPYLHPQLLPKNSKATSKAH